MYIHKAYAILKYKTSQFHTDTTSSGCIFHLISYTLRVVALKDY